MAEYSIEDLIAWCDKKVKEGNSLSIEWSGGGDDGAVSFLVDNKECEEPQAEVLADMMSDAIGYGWWNGDSVTSGRAEYNPESHLFKGENSVLNYEFPEEVGLVCNIPVRIPKSKTFSEITVEIINEEFSVSFFSESGETIEEDELLTAVSNFMVAELFKEIERQFPYIEHLGYSYVLEIGREDFSEEGEDLVFTIKEFSINIVKTTEEETTLDLMKILDKSNRENKNKEN